MKSYSDNLANSGDKKKIKRLIYAGYVWSALNSVGLLFLAWHVFKW